LSLAEPIGEIAHLPE
jgi:hypothetical protein